MKRILYVCTGNTCRSPMAQGLTNKYAKEHGLDISAISAGIFAEENLGISENANKVLHKEGIDMSYHKARQITEGDIENASVIICMTRQHALAVVSIYPQSASKIHVIGKGGISDPYGGNEEMYRLCMESIKQYIPRVIELAEGKNE